MTMKPCRECRAPLSTRAMVCPHCGYQCKRSFASRIFYFMLAILLMGLGLLLLIPAAGILAVSFAGVH
jgi:hypothetical protein